jgi:hypothetical protein
MSKLDEAMQEQMAYLIYTEHRSFSHLDFTSDRIKGQPYYMKHGTFRNKISHLMKIGEVEAYCHSAPAFYTFSGERFGKEKSMTPTMTHNHMGVSPVIGVTNVISEDNDITNLPIYKEIQKLPPEQKALHDIHLKFRVPDIWAILEKSKNYNQDPVSKDIALPVINIDNLRLRTTVHHTDTVTVIVGCSSIPIAITTEDIIRLSNALTRVEERTSRILDECGNMLPGGYENIPIPDHGKWTVTLWHFGTDSYNYKEYPGEKYCCTWQVGQSFLIRIYNKNMQSGKAKRQEIQERPQKPYSDAIRDKMNQISVHKNGEPLSGENKE